MKKPGSPLAAILALGWLVACTAAFLVLFTLNDTDDFAGWVPVFAVAQLGFCALVGTRPRPTASIGARAGVAAAVAGLFVLACGVTSLTAPIELLQLRLGADGDSPAFVAAYVLALGVALIGSLVTTVRCARLLAPVTARGVAAVVLVVSGTGLWSLAMGLTVYPLIPQRPWGLFDGFTAMLAGMCGAGALAFALPLFLFVWVLARRPAVDTSAPTL